MILNKARIILGKEGERVAELFLKKKGYKLVERNYRCKTGEVDLIVLDQQGGGLCRSEDPLGSQLRHTFGGCGSAQAAQDDPGGAEFPA